MIVSKYIILIIKHIHDYGFHLTSKNNLFICTESFNQNIIGVNKRMFPVFQVSDMVYNVTFPAYGLYPLNRK